MGEKPNTKGVLLRDTLDMLILKTLARGPLHGFAIAAMYRVMSEEFPAALKR